MRTTALGALPNQLLGELIETGAITGADPKHISPASLDLTLSQEIYEIKGLLLPQTGERVDDLLPLMGARPASFSLPLRAGSLYLVRLNERLNLPASVYGYCNPKSSTGRLDVHVRVLADGVPRFDSLTPSGYTGTLWLAIHPQSFGVQLAPGIPLTQLRLFTADTRLSELELELTLSKDKLMWHETEDRPLLYQELIRHDQDGAVILTAQIGEGVVGYECIARPEQVVDVRAIGAIEATSFFAPVYAENKLVRLKRNRFYILSSAERVRIPPTLAAEMLPMDERSGDFRSHYAGFLDPGWGWGSDGQGTGRPFTLEVRPFEDIVLRAGQPIAKIVFERLITAPTFHYDTKNSNYLTQSGPRLAKQFI